jgi:hypothetical protein
MVEAEGADMRAAVAAALTAAGVGAVFIAVVAGVAITKAGLGLMAAIAAARDRVTQACPEGALEAWGANRDRAARLMVALIVRRDGTRWAGRQRDEAAKQEVPRGEVGKEDRAEWPGHPERVVGWMDVAA